MFSTNIQGFGFKNKKKKLRVEIEDNKSVGGVINYDHVKSSMPSPREMVK